MLCAGLDALQDLANIDGSKAEERLSWLWVDAEVDSELSVYEKVSLSSDVERDLPVAVLIGGERRCVLRKHSAMP